MTDGRTDGQAVDDNETNTSDVKTSRKHCYQSAAMTRYYKVTIHLRRIAWNLPDNRLLEETSSVVNIVLEALGQGLTENYVQLTTIYNAALMHSIARHYKW